MNTIVIRGGRVIDPSQKLDRQADVWLSDGRVLAIGEMRGGVPSGRMREIDARGLFVFPGLIDAHVHLREPGDEAAETIETGSRAALESGFTGVACMPDTEPAVDNQASAEFVILQAKRAGNCRVWPIGAVTKGRAGEELAEMGGLVEGGAVAFTDSGRPIVSAEIMRRALEYASMFDKPVLSHPEVPELTKNGVMNEDFVSVNLGLPGMPAAAEEIMVDRDIHLARWTRGRLHLQNISCAGSVVSIRRSKEQGIKLSAEACPHHLLLTDEVFRKYDSVYKVNPPLRTQADVDAVIKGLCDGTIDVIASGHYPVPSERKLRELDVAPFGMVGLETLLPIAVKVLIDGGHMSWIDLIAKLTINPARILGLDRGSLSVGSIGDVTLYDPDEEWEIDPSKFHSKCRNTPFAGEKVRGRAEMVIMSGEIKMTKHDGSRLRELF